MQNCARFITTLSKNIILGLYAKEMCSNFKYEKMCRNNLSKLI